MEGFKSSMWKKIKTIIEIWLPKYIEIEERISSEDIKLLQEISAAIIERIFKPIRYRYKNEAYQPQPGIHNKKTDTNKNKSVG